MKCMKRSFNNKNPLQLYYMSFAILHMRHKDDRLHPMGESLYACWVLFTLVIIMFILCLLIRFPLFSNKSYAIIGFITCFIVYLMLSYRYIWGKTEELHIAAYNLDRRSKTILVACSGIYTLIMPVLLILLGHLCHEIV